MKIDNKFEFSQIVYLSTDPEQLERIVTRIDICPDGLMYQLSCGANFSAHYDFEISIEKKII